jgi:2-polyprenyl-3-methyl-5-hydroxy-6-metoxy-1,4-benzoquinol methylase
MDIKRGGDETTDAVQAGNRAWWTEHTMSYDWNDKVGGEKFSLAWFDEIDRRFVFGARLFAHGDVLFDRIIPFDTLAGKSVLEIGCGMGLHTELMSRAGANVTAIDVSPTSVAATRRRLELKGLYADVRLTEPSIIGFPDDSFDFIWAWGSIHHSGKTGVIIREIHRTLKPGGQTGVMVYNLEGMPAYATIMRDYLFGFWRGKTLDDCLWRRSDGYMARYYSRDMLQDIFGIFFPEVSTWTFGQDADAIPLPRALRRPVLKMFSAARLSAMANRRGSLLFAKAYKQ